MERKRIYYEGYVGNGRQQERARKRRTSPYHLGMANELRGSVDGWYFKQYVVDIIFYRYMSENFTKFVYDGVDSEAIGKHMLDRLPRIQNKN